MVVDQVVVDYLFQIIETLPTWDVRFHKCKAKVEFEIHELF